MFRQDREKKGEDCMIRSVPRNPIDRMVGEGDRVLRDKYGRIFAWEVGTEKETWDRLLKENTGSYESIAMYDTEKGMIV